MAEEKKRTPLYTVGRFLACIVFHTISPVTYIGSEKTWLDAPYIVIANHKSMMDPLVAAYPFKRYEFIFMGKKELAKGRFLTWLFQKLHMITVDRGNTDMAAMRSSIKALRDGNVLGIFPEGTRHHAGLMDELEDGVSLIALRSGVPLIPVLITPKYRLFHRTLCVIGDPIPTADLRAEGVNRDTCARLNARITETYRKLDAQYGVHRGQTA